MITRNEYLLNLEKQSKNTLKDIDLKERLKHVYQSDILTNGNEIYVLCKIDPETGDHYYAFERAPNIIEAQRKSMGLNQSKFKNAYWGMKQEYLTKKLGNNIIFDFTKM